MERDRGKQENMFMTASPGSLFGDWKYLFCIQVTFVNLSAVSWFARTTSGWDTGRVEGTEMIVGERGLSMTDPNWEKDDCVRGYGTTVCKGNRIEGGMLFVVLYGRVE